MEDAGAEVEGVEDVETVVEAHENGDEAEDEYELVVAYAEVEVEVPVIRVEAESGVALEGFAA